MKTCLCCNKEKSSHGFAKSFMNEHICLECYCSRAEANKQAEVKAKTARTMAYVNGEMPKAKKRTVHKYNKECHNKIEAILEQRALTQEFEL